MNPLPSTEAVPAPDRNYFRRTGGCHRVLSCDCERGELMRSSHWSCSLLRSRKQGPQALRTTASAGSFVRASRGDDDPGLQIYRRLAFGPQRRPPILHLRELRVGRRRIRGVGIEGLSTAPATHAAASCGQTCWAVASDRPDPFRPHRVAPCCAGRMSFEGRGIGRDRPSLQQAGARRVR